MGTIKSMIILRGLWEHYKEILQQVNFRVDVDEPFDVPTYAHVMFQFFLRNPICQEMGRKFKISFLFLSSDKDCTATGCMI
jgi:hypothetical protein